MSDKDDEPDLKVVALDAKRVEIQASEFGKAAYMLGVRAEVMRGELDELAKPINQLAGVVTSQHALQFHVAYAQLCNGWLRLVDQINALNDVSEGE